MKAVCVDDELFAMKYTVQQLLHILNFGRSTIGKDFQHPLGFAKAVVALTKKIVYL